MRIAISNIAWDVPEDEAVASMLLRHHVDAIDIAPGKYFPRLQETDKSDICRVRDWWAERGIEITGMQALLFGTVGLNLFGNARTQAAMLDHLNEVCRIASTLGAVRLVFGSPKNRDRTGLDDRQADDIAVDFFGNLGDIAGLHGVVICLEPNPTRYGANFMTRSEETAQLVSRISHPAIRMQLDIGVMTINEENSSDVIEKYAHLIGHIHASEPGLVTLGDGNSSHEKVAEILEKILPKHLVCIEMLAAKNESHLSAIERALRVAVRHYRAGSAGIGA